MGCKSNFSPLCAAVTLAFILIFAAHGEADSFPFRSVNVGDQLPAVTIRPLRGQQDEALSKYLGKPLVLVFFGADIPTKKERSVKALTALQKMATFLEEKGIAVLVVNAQGDEPASIDQVIAASASTFPVYIDAERQAYGNLGIFVMPSLMLVAADGRVTAGMGYSHDLGQRLRGEIEVLLGEKTRELIEEELRPEMVEKSAEAKGAQRHYHLGATMAERGQPEAAIRELTKAVELDPGLGKAHVLLGCLRLDAGLLPEAGAALARGAELEPEMAELKICAARLKAGEGALDEAIDDLNFMMLRHSRNPALHYVLGTLLEEKNDQGAALREYRKAYELLEKKMHEK